MKTKSFFLTLAALLVLTAVQAAPLSQTVASINADAKKEGGPARVVQSISKSTGIPAATIEKQKASTGLSYGDIFGAHSVAKASGKSFDDVAALKKKGQTWDQIAEASGVVAAGKKGAKAATEAPPKPSATPQKTLQQLQRERYQ